VCSSRRRHHRRRRGRLTGLYSLDVISPLHIIRHHYHHNRRHRRRRHHHYHVIHLDVALNLRRTTTCAQAVHKQKRAR